MDKSTLAKALTRREAQMRTQFGPALDALGLRQKREKLAQSPFDFLRGTCWLWADDAKHLCPEAADMTRVASVGDAHMGNFGLWRDDEHRLVWGVNDLDEAAEMPWGLDLVRLTSSIQLAFPKLDTARLAGQILTAYAAGLTAPAACLPELQRLWLRRMFEPSATARRAFWQDLPNQITADPVPDDFLAPLLAALPPGATPMKTGRRQAGLGSLGCPRFTVLAEYHGGPVAYEIKGIMPAVFGGNGPALANRLAKGPYRSPDASLRILPGQVLRRLSPDHGKLSAAQLAEGLRGRLIAAMAGDLAALHAGAGQAPIVAAELHALGPEWLASATKTCCDLNRQHWRMYRQSLA